MFDLNYNWFIRQYINYCV